LHVKWASFADVNQTAPVASSGATSTATTSATFGSTINYVANGMTVVVAGNGPLLSPTDTVTRTALQNAASIAGLMITTECVIAHKPEEGKKMGGIPGGMGGMGGGDMY